MRPFDFSNTNNLEISVVINGVTYPERLVELSNITSFSKGAQSSMLGTLTIKGGVDDYLKISTSEYVDVYLSSEHLLKLYLKHPTSYDGEKITINLDTLPSRITYGYTDALGRALPYNFGHPWVKAVAVSKSVVGVALQDFYSVSVVDINSLLDAYNGFVEAMMDLNHTSEPSGGSIESTFKNVTAFRSILESLKERVPSHAATLDNFYSLLYLQSEGRFALPYISLAAVLSLPGTVWSNTLTGETGITENAIFARVTEWANTVTAQPTTLAIDLGDYSGSIELKAKGAILKGNYANGVLSLANIGYTSTSLSFTPDSGSAYKVVCSSPINLTGKFVRVRINIPRNSPLSSVKSEYVTKVISQIGDTLVLEELPFASGVGYTPLKQSVYSSVTHHTETWENVNTFQFPVTGYIDASGSEYNIFAEPDENGEPIPYKSGDVGWDGQVVQPTYSSIAPTTLMYTTEAGEQVPYASLDESIVQDVSTIYKLEYVDQPNPIIAYVDIVTKTPYDKVVYDDITAGVNTPVRSGTTTHHGFVREGLILGYADDEDSLTLGSSAAIPVTEDVIIGHGVSSQSLSEVVSRADLDLASSIAEAARLRGIANTTNGVEDIAQADAADAVVAANTLAATDARAGYTASITVGSAHVDSTTPISSMHYTGIQNIISTTTSAQNLVSSFGVQTSSPTSAQTYIDTHALLQTSFTSRANAFVAQLGGDASLSGEIKNGVREEAVAIVKKFLTFSSDEHDTVRTAQTEATSGGQWHYFYQTDDRKYENGKAWENKKAVYVATGGVHEKAVDCFTTFSDRLSYTVNISAGDTLELNGDFKEVYIVDVRANKLVTGVKSQKGSSWVEVPAQYYRVDYEYLYEDVLMTAIIFDIPLSSRPGGYSSTLSVAVDAGSYSPMSMLSELAAQAGYTVASVKDYSSTTPNFTTFGFTSILDTIHAIVTECASGYVFRLNELEVVPFVKTVAPVANITPDNVEEYSFATTDILRVLGETTYSWDSLKTFGNSSLVQLAKIPDNLVDRTKKNVTIFDDKVQALEFAKFDIHRHGRTWLGLKVKGFKDSINLEPFDVVQVDLDGISSLAEVQDVDYAHTSATVNISLITSVCLSHPGASLWEVGSDILIKETKLSHGYTSPVNEEFLRYYG